MARKLAIEKGMVWAIILGIFLLAFFVIKPIVISIILGLLMAYIFSPAYSILKSRIKSKNLPAFLFIFILLMLIIAPIIYFAPLIVRQTYDVYSSLQNMDISSFLSKYISNKRLVEIISVNFDNFVGSFFSSFLQQFRDLLINLPSFLLQVAVFLFTFFYALRDSGELRDYVSSLSPFSKSTEEKFLKEFRAITNAIVFGQVLIGIIQGFAIWIGLVILGVKQALILGIVAGIVSIIPVLGSWLVWLPVGIFLIASGETFSGIFLLVYGALFVSSLDNLIRPYLIARQSKLPIALGVIGTVGGLYLFGLVGLILGPLILAYAMIILEFYKKGKLSELFGR